ncbi:MAG: RNA-guided endonuclease InsQ/TnpB family protein [Promethearchaeota archaeon]
MQLVRQIQMEKTPFLDKITFLSKNLFNVATYEVRQHFFTTGKWLRYTNLWKLHRNHNTYRELQNTCGSHPPQQVLKQVDRNFKSFFQAVKSWKKDPSKFKAMPKLPYYKRKNGKNTVYFTSQQVRNKDSHILLPKKMLKSGFPKIKTDIDNVKGVRIVPFADKYTIELLYNYEPTNLHLNPHNALGIDLGLENVIAASDNIGGNPLIIKGGVLKSINQYYNKELAKYKSTAKICNNADITHRILKIHRKRSNKIRDFFHKTSRKIVNHCIDRDIGTIIVGYNEGWKQNINIGKKNNQNFVSIPFLTLLQQIEYKAEMVDITVIRTSEEYTSQTCSCCGIVKKTNRKHRGLYVCSNCNSVLNADVNASRNILQKEVPKSNSSRMRNRIGNRGLLNSPIVLKTY